MNITRDDFQQISRSVKDDLLKIISVDGVDLILDNLLCDPRLASYSLRVSTKKINYDSQSNYHHLNSDQSQDVKRLFIFGQLFFAKNGCKSFLNKLSLDYPDNSFLSTMQALSSTDSITSRFSRRETLVARRAFTKAYNAMRRSIYKDTEHNKIVQRKQLNDLALAKYFYYQLNDINFSYASSPSHSYSRLVRFIETRGATLSLVCLAITMVASGLSLFPAFTPICAPIAVISGYLSLGLGIPLTVKSLSTMSYNAIRYRVAPTKGEVIKLLFCGVGIAGSAVIGGINLCLNDGLIGQIPAVLMQVKTVSTNLAKCFFGGGAQLAMKKEKHNEVAMAIIQEKNPYGCTT